MAAAATGSAPDEARLSRLVVRRHALSEPARLGWAIRAARAWLGPEVEPAPPGMHRHQADLRLRVSEHPSLVTFGKAAYVDLGPVQALDDGWQVEVPGEPPPWRRCSPSSRARSWLAARS